MSKKFVPKVLLLGTEKDLPEFEIDYEIVGHLKTERQENQVMLFVDGKKISLEDFQKIAFDFLLCTDFKFAWDNRQWLIQLANFGRLATTNFFRNYVSNIGFNCYQNVVQLTQILKQLLEKKSENGILDFDAYFYHGNIFGDPKTFMTPTPPRICELTFKIETIIDEKIEPIFFNVYDRVFKNFDELRLKYYDTIFFTAERSVAEWTDVLNWAMQSTRKIVAYVHEDSEAFEPLKNLSVDEAKIEYIPAVRGLWILIESERPEICRAYVCFHKPYYMPKLPDGYIKIHAGKKLSNIDLGSEFIGDDSGDNISDLNPFINELTATYWAWKNTRSDYVGFSHYCRYFVVPDDKSKTGDYVPIGSSSEHILTMNEAVEMLKDCDILVRSVLPFYTSYTSDRTFADFTAVRTIGYEIFCKHLSKHFPEYMPVIEKMESGLFLIGNSLFFTRWKVFDDYCKWLFSFIIPAAQEFAKYNFQTDQRTISYLGEEAFQFFVMHNNLRVKYLQMRVGAYESDEENFNPKNFH